jgi:hypothetical protein
MEAHVTRYIRVDYSVRTEVNLDELKTATGEFVAGIRRHHPEHRYTLHFNTQPILFGSSILAR